MTMKIICSIMNQIRKMAAQNGDDDPIIEFFLVTGKSIETPLSSYELHDDYIEIHVMDDRSCFVPVENITSILM